MLNNRWTKLTLAVLGFLLASGAIQPWSVTGSLILMMSVPVVVTILLLQRALLDRWLFGTSGAN